LNVTRVVANDYTKSYRSQTTAIFYNLQDSANITGIADLSHNNESSTNNNRSHCCILFLFWNAGAVEQIDTPFPAVPVISRMFPAICVRRDHLWCNANENYRC